MVSGPPIVGVLNSASPILAGVVQAIWANLTFLGLFQGISEAFVKGPGKAIVSLPGVVVQGV